MSTLLSDKPNSTKIKPSQVLGGVMGWMDEIGFERGERNIDISSVVKEVGSLVFEEILGVESESNTTELKQMSSTGTIEFNQNQAKKAEKQEKDRKEVDRKKTFYQNLKDEQLRAQMAKDRMWLEEEINDISANISTEEKNELLHLQADYTNNRSVYHKAELRKKIIEQRRKNEKQQKEASIPSPAKKISALDGAFEGASGSVGSGTANFGKGSVQ